MGNINFARVLLGGLVAGLVLNIGEFLLNEVVLKKQMEEFFTRFNLAPPGGSFIATAVGMTFLLGIVLVLLYAMIRPRFGAGPKAAFIAGLVAWFLVCVYNSIILAELGLAPINVVVIGILWALVEYVLAALAGAWLYKEPLGHAD